MKNVKSKNDGISESILPCKTFHASCKLQICSSNFSQHCIMLMNYMFFFLFCRIQQSLTGITCFGRKIFIGTNTKTYGIVVIAKIDLEAITLKSNFSLVNLLINNT